ncbi:methyltransferase domain-containing protein [Primorskyibacter aestuariivivens]|uniref:methyltransferase domain-containing protein n=1 Tax=Primorskyibacter aestuariivivens TaxID=1888912 RepID=UPI002301504F|nr:methyltransferase domain-containing protein [Primorskyibacter aestuariivivens]MDA7428425.1 methyltransferase domain-containing protein [Primorskyibacter aestuariivivens]
MTTSKTGNDWNPGAYDRFRGLRLRPVLDLLRAVGEVPEGPLTDLGCGSGAAGPVLRTRFGERMITGVDASPAMLHKARETGSYDQLVQADVADWEPEQQQALIFCNAVLHWLPDHAKLIPRLAKQLVPGGVLAVQVPGMNDAPSHATWRALTGRAEAGPGILEPRAYREILQPLGQAEIWETQYYQALPASDEGHPVRMFTQSTYGRPFLDALDGSALAALRRAYDDEMEKHYPFERDGTVLFPFRRVFFLLRKQG